MRPSTQELIEQKRMRQFLRYGPLEDVCKEFFHVVHRDRTGDVVPFVLNEGQRLAWKTVQEILKFEIERELQKEKEGGKSYIPNLTQRIRRKEPIGEWEIGLRLINGKARRGGFTTLWDHVGFRRICSVPNYKIGLFAQSRETAPELFGKVLKSYNAWPEKHIALRPVTTYDAITRFELENQSGCSVRTAGSSNRKVETARGWQFDFVHLSEYAWYDSYADVNQTVSVTRPHHWVIHESTANGIGNPFHTEWENAAYLEDVRDAWARQDYDFFNEWSGVYRFFFPWFRDSGNTLAVYDFEKQKLADSLTGYERGLMNQFSEITLEHIKWRRDFVRKADPPDLDPEQFTKQEMPSTPEEMFQTSSRKVFAQDIIATQLKTARARKPLWQGMFLPDEDPAPLLKQQANLLIYEKPKPGRQYIIGGDASYGTGGDDSALVVLDRNDGMTYKQVAQLCSNHINPQEFGHAATFLAEWFNNAFVIIETQGGGLQALDTLYFDNGYTNVFTRRNLDSTELDMPEDRKLGFQTHKASRDRIVATTMALWKKWQVAVHNVKLLKQLAAFQQDPDSKKLEAPRGQKDDLVFALCLAVWGGLRAAPPIDSPQRPIRRDLVEAVKKQTPGAVTHEATWDVVSKTLARASKQNRRHRRGVLPGID